MDGVACASRECREGEVAGAGSRGRGCRRACRRVRGARRVRLGSARRLDACPARSPPVCVGRPPDRPSSAATERSLPVSCPRRRPRRRGGRRAPVMVVDCGGDGDTHAASSPGRSGGQIRRSRLLVGRGVCQRPRPTISPSSARSRARAGGSPVIAGVRSAARALGPGTSCPRWGGQARSRRRCRPALLRRAVCLPSAASSAPTQRSCQALPCGSLRESCRTRA